MSKTPLRIAVVGGGPAGSLFALFALKYALEADREVAVSIYEPKDFHRLGPPGCNMCAGIIPVSVLGLFQELGLPIPPELILSQISSYALHTSACSLTAVQPDPGAHIISVFRGGGPRHGHPAGLIGFDGLVLEEAVARGATLRRSVVSTLRRTHPTQSIEVVATDGSTPYDLVVLATGVNAHPPALSGFAYEPPPTGTMCQSELYLGHDEVERRLGSSVHIFLPPDDVATYGILIPKGPFVTVSLLNARRQMRSLREFLAMDEVTAVLGASSHPVCGCLPRISVGLARAFVDDGFVAIGDASVTRLYKNGIGSALRTAERAAWTAVYRGHSREAFAAHYVPLCRSIDTDNRIGRLLFMEVPLLKHVGVVPQAHCRLASAGPEQRAAELQARVLWGMFTGAYSYRHLLRMALSPSLLARLALALGGSMLHASSASKHDDGSSGPSATLAPKIPA